MAWRTKFISPWPLSLYLHDNPDDDVRYQNLDSWSSVDLSQDHVGRRDPGTRIPFGITTPPTSFFLQRTRKDPYEKSRAKFDSKPKLPPINETPSNHGTLTASEIAEIGRKRSRGGSKSSSSSEHNSKKFLKKFNLIGTIHDSLRRSWSKRRQDQEAEMELLEWKLAKLQAGLNLHRNGTQAPLEPLEPVPERPYSGCTEEGYVDHSEIFSEQDLQQSIDSGTHHGSARSPDSAERGSDDEGVDMRQGRPHVHFDQTSGGKGRGSDHLTDSGVYPDSSYYTDSLYHGSSRYAATSTYTSEPDKDRLSIFENVHRRKRLVLVIAVVIGILAVGMATAGVAVYFLVSSGNDDGVMASMTTEMYTSDFQLDSTDLDDRYDAQLNLSLTLDGVNFTSSYYNRQSTEFTRTSNAICHVMSIALAQVYHSCRVLQYSLGSLIADVSLVARFTSANRTLLWAHVHSSLQDALVPASPHPIIRSFYKRYKPRTDSFVLIEGDVMTTDTVTTHIMTSTFRGKPSSQRTMSTTPFDPRTRTTVKTTTVLRSSSSAPTSSSPVPTSSSPVPTSSSPVPSSSSSLASSSSLVPSSSSSVASSSSSVSISSSSTLSSSSTRRITSSSTQAPTNPTSERITEHTSNLHINNTDVPEMTSEAVSDARTTARSSPVSLATGDPTIATTLATGDRTIATTIATGDPTIATTLAAGDAISVGTGDASHNPTISISDETSTWSRSTNVTLTTLHHVTTSVVLTTHAEPTTAPDSHINSAEVTTLSTTLGISSPTVNLTTSSPTVSIESTMSGTDHNGVTEGHNASVTEDHLTTFAEATETLITSLPTTVTSEVMLTTKQDATTSTTPSRHSTTAESDDDVTDTSPTTSSSESNTSAAIPSHVTSESRPEEAAITPVDPSDVVQTTVSRNSSEEKDPASVSNSDVQGLLG